MKTLELLKFFNSKIEETAKFDPENPMLNDKNKLGRSILIRTLNKFAASNNVGGVEVASTLLGYPDHYAKDEFYMINWKGWDMWLCNELGSDYKLNSYRKQINNQNQATYYQVLRDQSEFDMHTPINEQFSLFDFKIEYLERSTV